VQADAGAAKNRERVVEAAGNVARVQRRQPANGLQVAQASGRVLHIGLKVINRILEFRAALDRQSGKLAGDGLTSFMDEGVELLVEGVEQSGVAHEEAA